MRAVGRPRKLGDASGISIRIPDELLDELDAWAKEVRETGIGTSSVTRSDIVRDIVRRALEERRARRAVPTPTRPKAPPPKKTRKA